MKHTILAGPVREMAREKTAPCVEPTEIAALEWFASAADLCRAMAWLHGKDDRTALEIPAVNPGLAIPRDRFPYAGFKGGSEPGVLNLTFLLRTADGTAYALSAGRNNSQEDVEAGRFCSLVQSALHLLAKQP